MPKYWQRLLLNASASLVVFSCPKCQLDLIFHELLCATCNHTCGFVNSKGGGVDGDIVIVIFSPFVSGVEVVIRGAPSVRLVNDINYLRSLYFGMALTDSLLSVLKVTVDKYSQNVITLAQNIVRASSDNNAASLLGIFLNNL